MTFSLISVFAPLLYWLFLIDPFKRRPLSRNYLKLYKNGRFFIICLILAIILIVLDRSLLLSHRLGFPSIPLWFLPLAFSFFADLLLLIDRFVYSMYLKLF